MRTLIITFCLLMNISAFTQTGYHIGFKIDGLKDTTAYLGHYYRESTFVRDTAKVNSKGEFLFDGKKALDHGVYFLVLDKIRIFEFVVGQNQRFDMEANTADYIKTMKVKNDLDNKLFFENILFNIARYKEADPFLKVIKDSTLAEGNKKDARQAFSKINERVISYQDELIVKYPTTMTAKILKSTKVVKIPDPPKKANGNIDSTFQLRWYREHFFDFFDLSDEALLRLPSPVYKEKVYEYLDKLFLQQRDSVFKAITKIVAKAKKNKNTYEYIVWICTTKYQTPEIMGLEDVFVDLYDAYYANGDMDAWLGAKAKQNIKDYADRLRLSVLGRTAPNLIMKDVNEKIQALYALKNKYTIVFFFDPKCSHCREETPKLVEFYNKDKVKLDVEVFAVSADSSMTKIKDFAKEMKTPWITVNFYYSAVGHYQQLYDAISLPTLYLLDRKKRIIAKKIPIEKLEEFIINHERLHKIKPL